jgi:hypothetical protein
MSNNKTCIICYNKNSHDNLKCRTCNNKVCDDCYANIIYNNINFQFDFKEDKSLYSCPFCKNTNVFSTTINNYNTNNKLIKLLLQTMDKNNVEFNKLVDDIDYLRNLNDEILFENKKCSHLVEENRLLRLQLESKPHNNEVLQLEYKPTVDKLEKIEQLIKKTSKRTILFNQINDILTA